MSRLEKVAPNGETIHLNDEERYTDSAYCACLEWMEEESA